MAQDYLAVYAELMESDTPKLRVMGPRIFSAERSPSAP